MTENKITRLFVAVLIVAIIIVYAMIFAGPEGKPRKLTPAERQDSIDRKKPIAEG